jgi:hypothetical protein
MLNATIFGLMGFRKNYLKTLFNLFKVPLDVKVWESLGSTRLKQKRVDKNAD